MLPRILLVAAALAVASCGKGDAQDGGRGQRGPTQVGFVVVQPTSVPVQSSLGGRTVAFESSEVRPQVNDVALNTFDDDVPARKVRVDFQRAGRDCAN